MEFYNFDFSYASLLHKINVSFTCWFVLRAKVINASLLYNTTQFTVLLRRQLWQQLTQNLATWAIRLPVAVWKRKTIFATVEVMSWPQTRLKVPNVTIFLLSLALAKNVKPRFRPIFDPIQILGRSFWINMRSIAVETFVIRVGIMILL